MNSVQYRKFRTFFGPENSFRGTSSEMLRFGSHYRIRHRCVSCDGGNVSECGFELLLFHIFYMCFFGFPFIFRSWSRSIPGMNSWRCDSRDTQGNQKMNSWVGRRTAKHLRQANMDWCVLRLCFRHTILLYVFVTHPNIFDTDFKAGLRGKNPNVAFSCGDSPQCRLLVCSLELCHKLLEMDAIGE